MAEPFSASLAAVSRPATLLIEKACNALGRHFDPRQTVRMAEAQAMASRILAISEAETDAEIVELRHRAANRFVFEEMRNQSNMEAITGKAIPSLTEYAEPDKIDDDWVANFFDKSRIVSGDQMQHLWAKILAEEGNSPGSFSRKTVNQVADLDRRDAELFTNICRFGWIINRTVEVLIFDEQSALYNRLGINFNSIGQLEALGLVRFNGSGNFNMASLPQNVSASYGGSRLYLSFPNNSENRLNVGKVLLTQSGMELFRISEAKAVEGFFDYVYDRWANESLVPPRETQLEVSFNKLADQWIAETAFHSNPSIIAKHPAYSQIVAIGEQAIPFILEEISQKRNRPYWFQILNDITGMTPAPEETWGKVEEVAAAWLEWGREQGHLP